MSPARDAEPVVTSEERAALLSGLAAGRAAGPARVVRRYDFRSPDKFSKDQVRTLVTVHEGFARGATTALSAHLRTMVEIRAESVEQTTYRRFTQSLAEPAILAVVALPPLPSRTLWALDPTIAFFMIDRLLGGPGVASYEPRPLTDIEVAVVRRLFTTLFPAFREAWRNVANVQPRLEDLESQALFAQVAAPDDIALVVRHEVEAGAQRGHLSLCLPFPTLEPILPRLTARGWLGQEAAERGELARARLTEHVLDTEVALRVELGRARLPMGRVTGLAAGEVVRLDRGPEDLLTAYVAGCPVFAVRPGRRGRRLAVTVVKKAPDGGEVTT